MNRVTRYCTSCVNRFSLAVILLAVVFSRHQWAGLVLEACIFATILCGFFGIILKKNVLMKIIAMDVMSTGVIAYYVLVASRDGVVTPIVLDQSLVDGLVDEMGAAIAFADPVPQAVILTAIVIGFSIQALMLVGAMKLSRDIPTLETSEIERSHTP